MIGNMSIMVFFMIFRPEEAPFLPVVMSMFVTFIVGPKATEKLRLFRRLLR